MTSLASVGAASNIDRKSNLVWNLLANNVVVVKFKHYSVVYLLFHHHSAMLPGKNLLIRGGLFSIFGTMMIKSFGRLFLPCCREAAYAFHIAYDSCHVIYIFTVTDRAFVQVAFVYVSAIIANSIGNIESKVVASFSCGYFKQLTILFL